jgi:hypothetical protein
VSQLDDIEARLKAAVPGAITITPSDIHYLRTIARQQANALWRVERLAARWATLADGDRYYARHIRAALDDES